MNHSMVGMSKFIFHKIRVPTSSGNHGKPGKLLKKSSMHGKVMEFEKPEQSWKNHENVVKNYDKTTSSQKPSCRTRKTLVCSTAS